jgi:hypothetical protein
MTAFTPEAITRALADRDVPLADEFDRNGEACGTLCALCDAPQIGAEPPKHDQACPWLLAVEWVAAHPPKAPYVQPDLPEGWAKLPLSRQAHYFANSAEPDGRRLRRSLCEKFLIRDPTLAVRERAAGHLDCITCAQKLTAFRDAQRAAAEREADHG